MEFASTAKRPDKSNVIDLYVSNNIPTEKVEYENYVKVFTTVPTPLTPEERKEFIATMTDVACSSDAFFPFPDNIHRLAKVWLLV